MTIKKRWTDALETFEKDPSLENLALLKEAKKIWRKSLKDPKQERKGARTQWWTEILNISKMFCALRAKHLRNVQDLNISTRLVRSFQA